MSVSTKNRSDTGWKRHCSRVLMLTLLIWLLYCTEAVRNTLCEKVKFMLGPSNHRLALRGREPEAVTGKINRKYPVRLEP